MNAAGPNFVRYVGPVLEALHRLDGSGRPAEVGDLVADILSLPAEVLDEQLASGGSRFRNQVAWARFYLAKAGFIDSSARGVWVLTEKGLATSEISDDEALELFSKIHAEFGGKTSAARGERGEVSAPAVPPIEVGEDDTAGVPVWQHQLLERIQSLPPAGFERLCQRLLRESGFQQVAVTGRSGDGGLDGIGLLQVNPFVSFKVLFQCKRYAGSVASPQVRDFRGAMQGRADKGIILTTGTFTADASKEAVRDGVPAIELVDGDKLIEMFEELKLGLEERQTFQLDEAFFEQFVS